MSHDQDSYPGVLLSKRSGKSAAVFGGGGQRRGGIGGTTVLMMILNEQKMSLTVSLPNKLVCLKL